MNLDRTRDTIRWICGFTLKERKTCMQLCIICNRGITIVLNDEGGGFSRLAARTFSFILLRIKISFYCVLTIFSYFNKFTDAWFLYFIY